MIRRDVTRFRIHPAVGCRAGSTHDLAGIFWFCLPVALAIWLLFVHVLEQPTIGRCARRGASACRVPMRGFR